MAQSQMGPINCRQCDSWYASDRELRDHMQMAHRRCVPEQSTSQSGAQPDGTKSQLGTSKED
jgi:hypothetical protein